MCPTNICFCPFNRSSVVKWTLLSIRPCNMKFTQRSKFRLPQCAGINLTHNIQQKGKTQWTVNNKAIHTTCNINRQWACTVSLCEITICTIILWLFSVIILCNLTCFRGKWRRPWSEQSIVKCWAMRLHLAIFMPSNWLNKALFWIKELVCSNL